MGVSGSGKSTLLHILSTLLPPKSGSVLIDGQDIYAIPKEKMLEIRRHQVGIIFQSHYLFRGFNAEENLAIASLIADTKPDDRLVQEFGMESVLHQPIGALSGGQQQRLSILRILAKKPKLIFADEPTGNLDRETADNVMERLFAYVQDNQAVLFLVTHDHDLASRCFRCFELKDQRLMDSCSSRH